MLFSSKLNPLTSGSLTVAALASSILVSTLAAQPAFSQVVTGTNANGNQFTVTNNNQLVDCGNDASDPFCSNGAGATFPFPGFVGYFTGFFPDQFNYAGRGSGGGITAYNTCGNLPAGSPGVPTPLSFASTDAPLTQPQLDAYYVGGTLSFDSCWEQGFGPVVELPGLSGGVAVAYNVPGVPAGSNVTTLGGLNGPTGSGPGGDLTLAQYCGLFNGTLTTYPGTATAVTGVRRSDGSGTTFIVSSNLRAVCSPLNLWQYTATSGTVNRGSGQVSVPDDSAACQAATGSSTTTSLSNTVCWPAAFLSGSGNPGVASTVNAASGRFGYVEFGVALSEVGGTVDADNNPATLPATRVFPNLQVADLPNPQAALPEQLPVLAPFAGNVAEALNTTPDSSPATCRVVLSTPNPTDGYLASGVNYVLAYGDYTPDRQGANPALNSPAAARFQNQGPLLRDRTRALFTTLASNPAARAALVNLGYAPLPQAVANTVAQRALQCVQSVTAGTNPLDPPPQTAP